MTAITPELVLSAYGATDLGRQRKNNEDIVLVRDDLSLYVVADGAGGHASGEVASRLAVRSMENFFGATIRSTHLKPEFDRFGIPSGARRLSAAVLKANQDVLEIARSYVPHRGMGTTVVAACFSPTRGFLHVAHVGDSRCYRWRAGHLELLTQDHSLITDIIEQRPDLDDAVLARLPKNIVTRALGMGAELRVSLRSYTVVEGDRYLLCSDGLSNMLSTQQLVQALGREEPPRQSVQRLIESANAAGGTDNIAALVIHCEGGHALARPAASSDSPSGSYAAEAGTGEQSVPDPELLILGIEELEPTPEGQRNEDLVKRLGELFGWER